MFEDPSRSPQAPPRDAARLARDNRVLLSVAIVALALSGPLFMAGFAAGRYTAPRSGVETVSAQVPQVPQIQPVEAVSQPAPHAAPQTGKKDTAKKDTGKKAAVKKKEPASSARRPAARQVYLQLSATVEPKAQAMVDRLRKDGFPAVAPEVPKKPGLHRVLIGPFPAGEENSMRAELESKGFPGGSAIKKTF